MANAWLKIQLMKTSHFEANFNKKIFRNFSKLEGKNSTFHQENSKTQEKLKVSANPPSLLGENWSKKSLALCRSWSLKMVF